MCVCRSASTVHPTCRWTDFCEILYLIFLRKSFDAFLFWLKSFKNIGLQGNLCLGMIVLYSGDGVLCEGRAEEEVWSVVTSMYRRLSDCFL